MVNHYYFNLYKNITRNLDNLICIFIVICCSRLIISKVSSLVKCVWLFEIQNHVLTLSNTGSLKLILRYFQQLLDWFALKYVSIIILNDIQKKRINGDIKMRCDWRNKQNFQRGNSAPIMDNSPLSIIEMVNYKRKVTDFRFDEAQNSDQQNCHLYDWLMHVWYRNLYMVHRCLYYNELNEL